MPEEKRISIKKDEKVEIGASGTLIVGGIINDEEYNSDLYGTKGLDVYDEMRKGDATVRASLLSVKLPLLSTNWYIKAASEEDADLEVKKMVDKSLFENIDFNSFLREALNYFEFGYSVFEKVYQVQSIEGKQYITLQKLSSRKQKTIMAWETQNHEPGITQTTVTKGTISIPDWKLIIFTNDKEGENYQGVSLLRAAYQHWYVKKSLYLIESLAFERQGLGILELEIPANASEADKERAREIARNIRANEEAFLERPQDFKFEFKDMKAGSLKNPTDAIMHHDRQIMKNVLAQFLELGAKDSSGSYALSEDHSNLFLQSLTAAANYIKNAIQEQIVKKLVDLNFVVEKYPTIEFDRVGDRDLTQISDAIQKFVSSKVITPDPVLEAHIRNLANLPEMPDELKENYYDLKKEQQTQGLELTDKTGNKYEIKKFNERINNVHKLKEELEKQL